MSRSVSTVLFHGQNVTVVFNKHNTARVASCWFIMYYWCIKFVPLVVYIMLLIGETKARTPSIDDDHFQSTSTLIHIYFSKFFRKFLRRIEFDSILSSLTKYHILNYSRSVDDFFNFRRWKHVWCNSNILLEFNIMHTKYNKIWNEYCNKLSW